jgi:hypothetical protein
MGIVWVVSALSDFGDCMSTLNYGLNTKISPMDTG